MRRLRTSVIALVPLLAFSAAMPGKAPASGKTEGLETPAPGTISGSNKRKLKALIDAIAKKRAVDPHLVHAVIAAESGYNPTAVSPKGAIGLMQVMPETAADYGVDTADELFEPRTNVETGTRHLKRLLKKYKNIRQAIMAYNAGEGALARNNGAVTYQETRQYALRVINNYWRNQGKKPLKLRDLGLPRSGRVKIVINSTVRDLDPGLHTIGPESKPMFVLESKD